MLCVHLHLLHVHVSLKICKGHAEYQWEKKIAECPTFGNENQRLGLDHVAGMIKQFGVKS